MLTGSSRIYGFPYRDAPVPKGSAERQLRASEVYPKSHGPVTGKSGTYGARTEPARRREVLGANQP
jgi:hypothetical protein